MILVYIVDAPQVLEQKSFSCDLSWKLTCYHLLLQPSCVQANRLAFEVANFISLLLDVTPGQSHSHLKYEFVSKTHHRPAVFH